MKQLDKLLVDYQTEYHYLFSLLYNFESDGTIGSCYHIPNIARKVVETFLEFYEPSTDKLHNRLKNVNFDEFKKTAILKFVNEMSHYTGKGFDPAIVAETQKNVKYLLEMIQHVAPNHFNGLERLARRVVT